MHALSSIMLAIIWNCRCMGRPEVVRSLRVFAKTHKPSLLFLFELRTSSTPKIQNLCYSLGFQHLEFIPAIGRAGGILLTWKDYIDLLVIAQNGSLISGLVFMPQLNITQQYMGFYGPTNPTMRPQFWDQLLDIEKNWKGSWLIIGDFNTVLEQKDKISGKIVA